VIDIALAQNSKPQQDAKGTKHAARFSANPCHPRCEVRRTPQSPEPFSTVFLGNAAETSYFARAQPLPSTTDGWSKMIKLDRILCPTDLSTESDEALHAPT
jgi:hypothetical protein